MIFIQVRNEMSEYMSILITTWAAIQMLCTDISEVYPEENLDLDSPTARSNTEISVQFYYSPEFKDITPGKFWYQGERYNQ